MTGRGAGNVYLRVHRDHSGSAVWWPPRGDRRDPRSALIRRPRFLQPQGFVVGTPLAEAAGPRALEQGQSPCSLLFRRALVLGIRDRGILRVLVLAGAAALMLTFPIALAIGLLLAIVATSYRQTIKAYPQGGGSYIVTKDNLGTWPALVAGASLLIDYVLTVAVSISAGGVAAITSALPQLHDYNVELGVGFVVLITLLNLRGVRESGAIFAAPTYLFIVMAFAMIRLGMFRYLTDGPVDMAAAAPAISPSSSRWRCSRPPRFRLGKRSPYRRGGHLRWRAAFKERVAQRSNHPALDGGHPRRPVPRH